MTPGEMGKDNEDRVPSETSEEERVRRIMAAIHHPQRSRRVLHLKFSKKVRRLKLVPKGTGPVVAIRREDRHFS
jgi:hypothetical protein